MKSKHIKKFIALFFVVISVTASASAFKDVDIFTEPSYLLFVLLGLGVMALGRLRQA